MARRASKFTGLCRKSTTSLGSGSITSTSVAPAARATAAGMHVLVLEPEPTDVLLFLKNPVNFDARRAILEYAYRTTRERIALWIEKNRAVVERFGWKAA